LPNRKGNLGIVRNIVHRILLSGENPFMDFIKYSCW